MHATPRHLAALASLALTGLALAEPFEIRWSTIDCGGGTISDARFTLTGTIGQPDAANPLVNPPFALAPGFFPGFAPSCPADFNGDGFLDFFDFNDFADCYDSNNCPPGKSGDYNNDGFVDFFDFDDFVAAFDSGC
jgi:hypothetical protein